MLIVCYLCDMHLPQPANILLDHDLHAYLGDTGFAKAAQRGGEASLRSGGEITGRIVCSPGFADPDVLNGECSELTDGFAVGVTLLVVLTHRNPVDIEDACEQDNGDTPFEEIPAERLAEPSAGWPVEVAQTLKDLYKGLCVVRKRKRLGLAEVVPKLGKLLEYAPSRRPSEFSDAYPMCASAPSAATPGPTPLSIQVRGMRICTGDHPERSVQRNVTEAFNTFVRQLDQLYMHAAAQAPDDYKSRIDYWRDTCGLPNGVHTRMHVLRKWRNMSEHHLDQPGRWANQGPDAQAASQHLAELKELINAI